MRKAERSKEKLSESMAAAAVEASTLKAAAEIGSTYYVTVSFWKRKFYIYMCVLVDVRFSLK